MQLTVQRSAKRRGCLLSYSQAEPGRESTQPSPRLLAEPCCYSDHGTFLTFVADPTPLLIHPPCTSSTDHPWLDRFRSYWSRNLISQFNCPMELSKNVHQLWLGSGVRENYRTAMPLISHSGSFMFILGVLCAILQNRFPSSHLETGTCISPLIWPQYSNLTKAERIPNISSMPWLHMNSCSSRIIAKFPSWC